MSETIGERIVRSEIGAPYAVGVEAFGRLAGAIDGLADALDQQASLRMPDGSPCFCGRYDGDVRSRTFRGVPTRAPCSGPTARPEGGSHE